MKTKTLLFACLLASSQAATLAINFSNGSNLTDPAGAFGTALANWSNVNGASGNTTISGVTFTWTSQNLWTGVNATSGDSQVGRGFLDDSGNAQSVTISGLSQWVTANAANGYEITVINASDGVTGFVSTDLSISNGGALLTTLTNPYTAAGGPAFAATNKGATLTSNTLFVKPQNRVVLQRGGIAGIIVNSVVPEPSVALLGGLGALALLRRRRA